MADHHFCNKLCTHFIINWPVLIDSEVNCTCTRSAHVHVVHLLYMYMFFVHVYDLCTCIVHVHDYTEVQIKTTILSVQFGALDFLSHFQLEAVDQLDSEMKVAVSLVSHVLQLFEINLSFPSRHCSLVVNLLVLFCSVLAP